MIREHSDAATARRGRHTPQFSRQRRNDPSTHEHSSREVPNHLRALRSAQLPPELLGQSRPIPNNGLPCPDTPSRRPLIGW